MRGNGGKKGGKRRFLLYLGGGYDFGKGGGGKNINYLDNIHPCLDVNKLTYCPVLAAASSFIKKLMLNLSAIGMDMLAQW